MEKLYACIMAGGSGERFWPLSRKATPKHLLKLFSKETLIGETVDRVAGVVPFERIFVLTNEIQLESTRKVLPSIPHENIIAEPAKRDTAPAAALATALVHRRDPDAVVALLSSDALIRDSESFQNQLADAAELASSRDAIVTISIHPTWPSTGFGYLELGESLPQGSRGSECFHVLRFVEKPDAETAAQYLERGNYGWNACIFVYKLQKFIDEARSQQPALFDFIQGFEKASDVPEYLQKHFSSLPKISVDYAIMEHANEVFAVKSQFDWDDVGTWTALEDHIEHDQSHNAFRGKVVNYNASNNIAFSEERLIALCGVKDLVVVETPDAILVAHKNAVQDIKKLHPLLPEDLR